MNATIDLYFNHTKRKKTNLGVSKITNTQDYFETDEERETGHVDIRSRNFECDNPDPNLGCDLGIDVQG